MVLATDVQSNILQNPTIRDKYLKLRAEFEIQNPELFNVAVPDNKANREIWDNVRGERIRLWREFIENYYGPAPKPLCRTCNEGGWVCGENGKAKLCPSCQGKDWEKIKYARRMEFSNTPEARRNDSFNTFKPRAGTKTALECVGTLANGLSEYKLILLCGRNGVGKTHLGHAAVNRALERGLIACFWYVPALFSKWRSEMAEIGNADIFLQNLETCGLLVLDDIGVRPPTEAQKGVLEQLINARYHAELPLIATTNLDPTELGDAIHSRFLDSGLSKIITMDISDYRPQKGAR